VEWRESVLVPPNHQLWADVYLEFKENYVRMMVKDNGRGFDLQKEVF
jgi:signal transduction histidine kinase